MTAEPKDQALHCRILMQNGEWLVPLRDRPRDYGRLLDTEPPKEKAPVIARTHHRGRPR